MPAIRPFFIALRVADVRQTGEALFTGDRLLHRPGRHIPARHEPGPDVARGAHSAAHFERAVPVRRAIASRRPMLRSAFSASCATRPSPEPEPLTKRPLASRARSADRATLSIAVAAFVGGLRRPLVRLRPRVLFRSRQRVGGLPGVARLFLLTASSAVPAFFAEIVFQRQPCFDFQIAGHCLSSSFQ